MTALLRALALRDWAAAARTFSLLLFGAACLTHPEPPSTKAPLPSSSAPAALLSVRAIASSPAPSASPSALPSRPPPACVEHVQTPGPWPRALAPVEVRRAPPPRLGALEQTFSDGASHPLRFFGAHLFDLLGKLDQEGGPSELDRRRLACAALDAVALAGAPVVRLWGSLKRTGTAGEVERAAELLALVVDENARRERPLRFVITLLNHQPGYGSPEPERSLDEQDPQSPWSARQIYLGGSWRSAGTGLLASRIEAFRARRVLVESKEILGWELVNELDTHRVIHGPGEARRFREGFVVPALALLAESFPQPILLGDLRAPPATYAELGRSLLDALPAPVLGRLVWTSHVYAPRPAPSAAELAAATFKLDHDLALASERGLPFLLGELGQLAPGAGGGFCRDGPAHALGPLFEAVLDAPAGPSARRAIAMALFWGEGQCGLAIPMDAGIRRVTLGAGGDSADLGPGEAEAREQVKALRREPRFVVPLGGERSVVRAP
jgi:hypothetical protein